MNNTHWQFQLRWIRSALLLSWPTSCARVYWKYICSIKIRFVTNVISRKCTHTHFQTNPRRDDREMSCECGRLGRRRGETAIKTFWVCCSLYVWFAKKNVWLELLMEQHWLLRPAAPTRFSRHCDSLRWLRTLYEAEWCVSSLDKQLVVIAVCTGAAIKSYNTNFCIIQS